VLEANKAAGVAKREADFAKTIVIEDKHKTSQKPPR
jgi:hypothetical protein